MLKMRFSVAILSFLGVLSGICEAEEQRSDAQLTFLRCKPDPQEKLSGEFSFLIDRQTKLMEVFPIREKLKFEENETELFTKILIKDELVFEIAVNKYTLRYRMFNTMNTLTGDHPTIVGQCSIEHRRL